MEDKELGTLIKEHLYNNLKYNYNYTIQDLRKKVGLRHMGAKQRDFFTVGLVRQMVKDGKMKRFEVEGKTFYTKK